MASKLSLPTYTWRQDYRAAQGGWCSEAFSITEAAYDTFVRLDRRTWQVNGPIGRSANVGGCLFQDLDLNPPGPPSLLLRLRPVL